MKIFSSENEKLARDVLHDANYAAFRRELENLGRAEFCRAHRKIIPAWLPLAASLVLVAATLWWTARPCPVKIAPVSEAESGLAIVRSAPLAMSEVIRSAPDQTLLLKTRRPAENELLRTDRLATVSELNDAELLQLLSKSAGGFVQVGDRKKLVLFF